MWFTPRESRGSIGAMQAEMHGAQRLRECVQAWSSTAGSQVVAVMQSFRFRKDSLLPTQNSLLPSLAQNGMDM